MTEQPGSEPDSKTQRKPQSKYSRSITKAERERVLDLTQRGLSRNDVATLVGISAASVSRLVKLSGLSFSEVGREQVRPAVEGRLQQLALRRAALAEALLGDAERLRERLWEGHEQWLNGPNGPDKVRLDKPPLRDARDGVAATQMAIKTHIELTRHDGDDADEAKGLLQELGRQLGINE